MQPAPLTEAIAGSVAIKASVVEGDEREADGGRRHLLNYGHTIGHAIESVAGYGVWLHGEAVAVGMFAAARLGLRLGVTPAEVVERQEALLARFGLPTRADGLPIDALLQAALWDKKVSGGNSALGPTHAPRRIHAGERCPRSRRARRLAGARRRRVAFSDPRA